MFWLRGYGNSRDDLENYVLYRIGALYVIAKTFVLI